MENLHIKLEGEKDTVIIREGKAPELHELNAIKFKGTFDALLSYYKIRKPIIKGDDSMVHYSYEKNSIKLLIRDKEHNGDVIEGVLEFEKEFEGLQLNSDKLWNPEEFFKYFRLRLHLFLDRAKALETLNKIRNFKVQVTSDMSNVKDERGNRNASLDKKVDTKELPETLAFNMSIFKGHAATSFYVEVGIDSTDTSLRLYLYSSEIPGLVHDTKVAVFADVLSQFEGLPLMEY
jgi:hypothetical protein